MEILWQVEVNEWCQKILEKHWPGAKRYGDIKAVDPGDLEAVDLICGGFPCQPHSKAGKRKGVADERWLWPEFHRIICGVRPRWVLVENVPGILSVNAGQAFGEVVGDLASSGYHIEWDCISAAAIGAPHRRDRVWVVAHTDRAGLEGPRAKASSTKGGIQTFFGSPLSGEALANTDSFGESGQDYQPHGSEPGRAVLAGSSSDLADTHLEGLEGHRRRGEEWHGSSEGAVGSSSWPFPQTWEPEPAVGRVAHGISRRVDRLRGLGNAVVPQVVEWIGRRIMEVNHGIN